MSDFETVLKKTIDAQADQSPELRQRVYAKSRATIEQKLISASAAPAVAVRQRKILEDAIAKVEAFFGPEHSVLVQSPPITVRTMMETMPIEPSDIVNGPKFSLVGEKLAWMPILPEGDETERQAILLERLRVLIGSLSADLSKEANSFPELARAVQTYEQLLSQSYEEIDTIALWVSGGAILSYERAYREQNIQRTISNPIEPPTAAKLEQVCNLHAAFSMGIKNVRDLIFESGQAQLNFNELESMKKAGPSLLDELADNTKLFDTKSRHYSNILRDQFHALGWNGGQQAYGAYATLRNVIHSLIKYSVGSEPNLASIIGLASGTASLIDPHSLEFTRNAITALQIHGTSMLSFFNHSPEFRAYISWALALIASIPTQQQLDKTST